MNEEDVRVPVYLHQAMATEFWLQMADEQASYMRQAARACWDELDRLESLLSRHVPSSDISRLNRLPPGQPLSVDPDTYDCLDLAQRMERHTGGAFNVAYGSVPARPSGEAIRLDSKVPAIQVLGTGVQLDLGGIGKGYALDCLLSLLDQWDISRCLLGASASTVLAGEPPPGRAGWVIPFGRGAERRQLQLTTRALSGSGTEVKGAHVVDPRGGTAPACRQVWASAATAAEADALSTALMVMSDSEIDVYRRCHPSNRVWVEQ
jgi:thiamine biosynthesis lipoprotein